MDKKLTILRRIKLKIGTVVRVAAPDLGYYNMTGVVYEQGYITDVLLVDAGVIVSFRKDDLEPYNKRLIALDGKLEVIARWLDGEPIEYLVGDRWKVAKYSDDLLSILKQHDLRIQESEKFQWVFDNGHGKELTNGYYTEEDIKERNPNSKVFIKIPNS
jgi:hypothetical protein